MHHEFFVAVFAGPCVFFKYYRSGLVYNECTCVWVVYCFFCYVCLQEEAKRENLRHIAICSVDPVGECLFDYRHECDVLVSVL